MADKWPDDYECEGQMSVWDYISEEPQEIDWAEYMNPPIEDKNDEN